MRYEIQIIPCYGLAGIFKIGRLSLTSGRRPVSMTELALRVETAENTMIANSLKSA
jgi:hypothetical protein